MVFKNLSVILLMEDVEELKKHKAAIRDVFDSIDVDGSGLMDKEEFSAAVFTNPKVKELISKSRMLSNLVALSDFDAIFQSFDCDGGGSISFEEFWMFCRNESDEENIRKIFDAIDTDGSRYLTKEELVTAFKTNSDVIALVKQSKCFGKIVEDNEWDQVIREMDTDQSGDGENKIDYPEFWKWCKSMAAKVYINQMKAKAAQRQRLIAGEKLIRLKLVKKQLNSHTFHAGSRYGGTYSVSISPDPFLCIPLKEEPNPFAKTSRGSVQLTKALKSIDL